VRSSCKLIVTWVAARAKDVAVYATGRFFGMQVDSTQRELRRSPLPRSAPCERTRVRILPTAPSVVGLFEAATLVTPGPYAATRPVLLVYSVVHGEQFLLGVRAGSPALRPTPVSALELRQQTACGEGKRP
jgi:hypothetical protein